MAKDLNRNFISGDIQMANKTYEDMLNILLGVCKSKQRDTTTHLLECL